MLILVTNVGSTSLKYKLFEMPDERVVAAGKLDRIGEEESRCSFTRQDGQEISTTRALRTHAEGVEYFLSILTHPEHGSIGSLEQLQAVGFKVIHARGYSGTQILTPEVIQALKAYSFIIPVHNPPYIRAIEDFRKILPAVPLVGLFETAFHQTLPEAARTYGIPAEIASKHGLYRCGFHGASHGYLTGRYAELKNIPLDQVNIITCHLGGSSSLTAIKQGKSFDTSFGFSTQSGLPSATRAGDIDPYIIPYLVKSGEFTLDQVCELLAQKAGLLGVSGVSGDMRDLEAAAAQGNQRAQLAIDVYVHQVRKYIGAYIAILPETEALLFAGGIGERSVRIREKICAGLEHLGLRLEAEKNEACLAAESMIANADSPREIWVVPTDEEIIVARETYNLLQVSGVRSQVSGPEA